tara:strand:- start:992 stop:1693 length:702 start_codon:yes stop_codon:yes gene_type:complete
MTTTLEKIKNLLLSKEENKTKLYAEMILDDGRVLATEDDEFIVGSIVMVVGDDGETAMLGAGTYTLQDGSKLTIDDESKVLTIGEEEEEVEAEEEKEEMKEHEEEDKMEEIDEEELSKAIFEHTPDHIDKEKAKEMAKKVKEMAYGKHKEEEKMSEEVVKENKEEEMVEMSKDMISSLVEEVEDLKAQIIELEKEPGAEGFTHNPEVTKKENKKPLISLSHHERVRELINNYK